MRLTVWSPQGHSVGLDIQSFKIEDGRIVAPGYEAVAIVESDGCGSPLPQEATPSLPTGMAVPTALLSTSDPLESEEVVSLWREFIIDTEIVGTHPTHARILVCGASHDFIQDPKTSDGGGIVEYNSSAPIQLRSRSFPFDWAVSRSADMAWNEAELQMQVFGTFSDGASALATDTVPLRIEDDAAVSDDYETFAITASGDCS